MRLNTTMDNGSIAAAALDILPIQPKPRRTLHAHVPAASPTGTIITRTWAEGDMGRCGRCGQCQDRAGEVCTVYVDILVPRADAEDWCDKGCRWADWPAVAATART